MNGKRLWSASTRVQGEEGVVEEGLAVDGRRIGKRRKKKKGKSSSSLQSNQQQQQVPGDTPFTPESVGGSSGVDTPVSGSGNEDEWEENAVGGAESSGADDDGGDMMGEEEESSIFGQTAGASNATWVECDRCKKVRDACVMCNLV